MTNYDYWRPAEAAILLAVFYPLCCILVFTAGGDFPPIDLAELAPGIHYCCVYNLPLHIN